MVYEPAVLSIVESFNIFLLPGINIHYLQRKFGIVVQGYF